MSLVARLAFVSGPLSVDLSLAAASASTIALVGPNGAGKTSILRALCGLQPLAEGRIEVDGVCWEDPTAGVRVPPHRRSVGVVFQDLRLFPHLSALENVAFGVRSRGASSAVATERAHEWLDRLGLGERARNRPAQLSGGEAQRVALARALATRPRLLLLDEPTASADPAARQALRRILTTELADYDGTRVLVTHDLDEARQLATAVIEMRDGRSVADPATSGGAPAAATWPRTSRENGPR